MKLCKKICNECPFSKNSLPGYLGGVLTTEEIHNSIKMEMPFACHKQLGDDVEENGRKLVQGEIDVCRGYIATATKSAKLFGGISAGGVLCANELSRLQKEITTADKDQVMPIWEFKKYHDS